MRKALLAAVVASLLTGTVIALGQSFPGTNSPYNLVWNMVWEAATLKPTYSASGVVTSTDTAIQDVCSLAGSATKTIRVRRVVVSGTAGAVEQVAVAIIKHSTAFTINGATPGTQPTVVSRDSANSAATAVVETWTTNPTAGTIVGNVLDRFVAFPNATTSNGTTPLEFDFGDKGGSALVLRGVAQNISVNLGAINFNTGKVNCTFEWTEE